MSHQQSVPAALGGSRSPVQVVLWVPQVTAAASSPAQSLWLSKCLFYKHLFLYCGISRGAGQGRLVDGSMARISTAHLQAIPDVSPLSPHCPSQVLHIPISCCY